jgi:hypothetical protein
MYLHEYAVAYDKAKSKRERYLRCADNAGRNGEIIVI